MDESPSVLQYLGRTLHGVRSLVGTLVFLFSPEMVLQTTAMSCRVRHTWVLQVQTKIHTMALSRAIEHGHIRV